MKKMNKLTVAALALVSMAFASTAASAQVTTSPGDLILGFQITAAPNSSPTDLEVDLGSYSLFTTTATIDLSSKLSVNDLISAFGSGWANGTAGVGVNWGAAANAAGGTSATKYNLDITSVGAKPNGLGTNTLNGYYQDIVGLTGGSGGINGSPVASTSTSALIGNSGSPASGIANSYTGQESKLAGLNGNIEMTGAGTDELYQYVGAGNTGSTVDLGTLKLTSAGGLTFTGSAAAVPEPSAYALGICAVLLFIVLRRRATVA
jgi:hypothetical protein